MKPKKILASVFLSTALVLAPAGVASASPVVDTSPGVVAVNHDHRDYDKHHKNDHKRDRDHGKHHNKDWDRRWDNHWRPDCFWFGPWLVCSPW
ncbi:hypothetical protein [Rhodococcus rhodochrous]|jgi:ABC-type Zn2+ transport system substrate-binding protein/surface adhesin|uniref:hypothetical protein n=1 Tax=Rhodococcus rhodochrous TaxID=1829 RepID=UPI0023F6B5B4